MALIHALVSYRDKGLLASFEMFDANKGMVTSRRGRSMVIAMATEYIVSATEVREACRNHPRPEVLLYNTWDQVTPQAYKEADSLGVRIRSFGAFAHELQDSF